MDLPLKSTTPRDAYERLIQQLISIPLRHPGVLPTVAQVDPYKIGVSRSNYVDHDPYITREADQSLDDILKNALFVLVLGASKAGKSRTAVEAAKRTMPLSKFIVPKPGLITDLISLEPRLDVGTTPAILWLHELDRYLASAGDLDLPLLDRLARNDPPIVILSTMTTRQHHRCDVPVEIAAFPSRPGPARPAQQSRCNRAKPVIDAEGTAVSSRVLATSRRIPLPDSGAV